MKRGRTGSVLAVAVPLLAILAAIWASGLAWVEVREWRSVDWRFGVRGPEPGDAEVLVVALDDATLERLHLRHPLPPLVYARVVERLRAAGAGAIVWDLLYADATRECDPPDQDRLLAERLREAPDVVWAFNFSEADDAPIEPIPEIRAAIAETGYVNFPDSLDGRIRVFHPEHRRRPALTVAALLVFAGFVPPAIRGPEPRIINFRGPPETFETVAMIDVLDGKIAAERIAGRICLIGPTFSGAQDRHPTPFHDVASANTPGVEIHANILGNMLRNDFLRRADPRFTWIGVALLAALLSALVAAHRPWLAGLAWIAASLGWTGWAIHRFLADEIVLLVAPLGALAATFWLQTFLFYVLESRQRREIRALFAAYVDPKVVDWLERRPDSFDPKGERRIVTVLDTDIQGFTTITENTDPAALVTQLNEYFEAIAGAAMEAGGMIDKYVGDALMVIFGFPMEQSDHAGRAVQAAKEIIERVERLNRSWREQGLPELYTRVGICSGEVIMGAVGSRARKSVTAMGDAANVASRLEGLNKRIGTRILLSESTARLLPSTMPLRDLGEVKVRGLARSIRVFNPTFDVAPARLPADLSTEDLG